MGLCPSFPSRLKTKKGDEKEKWSESWKDTLTSIGFNNGPITSAGVDVESEDNIFKPIQQDNILPQIPISCHHPVPRKGIVNKYNKTLQTNKFYANAFLGNQDQPIWTHPYFIWWGRGNSGKDVFETWGMNIAHIEEQELVYGEGNPARAYINPRRQSLIITAPELDRLSGLTTDTHLPFSVNINLVHRSTGEEPKITFPVVQGMGFVTASFRSATPIIQCPGKGFKSISQPVPVGKSTKFRIKDDDGRDWVAYVNPVPGLEYDTSSFIATDEHNFIGPSNFKGTIQIAKNPLGPEGEAIYDKAAGSFAAEAILTGTIDDIKGKYTLSYTRVGQSPLLMFVLPHHIQSLDSDLKPNVTKLQLRTTTKGIATAIWGEKLTFLEPNLPTTMGFAPWTPTINLPRLRQFAQSVPLLTTIALQDMHAAIALETPPDSMYFAGKTLAKFATILFVLKDILNNPGYVEGLTKLKAEMARYIQNKQKHPLFYDDDWKGLVSNAGFTEGPGADFGNTYYNDHHFHYGYFVYTAAVIGTLDPGWLAEGDNKAWTNMLVKDFAESDYNGRDYPFSRSFDWWVGHSWAKGLFESADGKDQESSSEDGFAGLAVRMWGRVCGDGGMESRGTLMLALQSRTFNTYFYISPTNPLNPPNAPSNQSSIHPPLYTPNLLTGILFENKVDHATYFGTAPHLIHGIHMLPISPATFYLRRNVVWVREEWEKYFSNGRALGVEGGWKGVLVANSGVLDARGAWEFFLNGEGGKWEGSWIDGGASRCWYLVWVAGVGGLGVEGDEREVEPRGGAVL
ncbi:endo-1,3(4)-beta-glucanase 1 precursor [Dendryphion nanum]|uniref:glucan endo-1,3-beta-D-glucosidase n=1 Tax=Dendryphion nanum TaxID=256645 RepID=A0A9P9EED4_9PLEO|nr:endo-1,3(4)-beta-glucanase 1 precursor [Dendryphion nanum]